MTGIMDLKNNKVFFSSFLVSAPLCVGFIISHSVLSLETWSQAAHKCWTQNIPATSSDGIYNWKKIFLSPDDSPTGPYGLCATQWSSNEYAFPRPPVEGQRESEAIPKRMAVFVITRGDGNCRSKKDLQQTPGFRVLYVQNENRINTVIELQQW